ncbi:NAD(P)-binding protein [Sodiomyces alkalinus F11]|uniref:NAD(P)-binding protein n=1 Tax=Sodiomyces alkalinus (strain CBS 110278 / VKM F-3762 / F11) TaxID=1314773 RepID=A0A3N2PNP9_SODAK|nr:NAD(P)-binding protein [Sodiomyces alkalinus F11]ROT36148.1 NAD(P)-binding protein [Sodiomyces alkalinus F11]
MALELARQGAAVLLVYTSESSTPKAEAVLGEIAALPTPPEASRVQVDLTSADAPAGILSALDSWLGPSSHVDILVNNAGVEVVKPLADTTPADYDKVYSLNVHAPIRLTQALLPRLNPEGGNRIINIGSVGSRAGFAGLGLYCSSKAALEGLTRCWAAELGGDGTTVNQVNPGPVQSEMLANIPPEIVEGQKRNTPVQRRLGTVKEVAEVVAWLASPASSWITGQVLSASGGWAMY